MSRRHSRASLRDKLVGSGKQRRGHRRTERLGSRQIDDEIELGWQLDRDVARCGPALVGAPLVVVPSTLLSL